MLGSRLVTQTVQGYTTLIRERHLDTFGHVNNAAYLTLLEEARWEWITARGYGLQQITELGIGPVVLECKLSFRKELHLRQKIYITSETESYVGKIMRVKQLIRLVEDQTGEPGELSCEAEFVIALFDLKLRKIIEPSQQWLSAIDMVDRYQPKRS